VVSISNRSLSVRLRAWDFIKNAGEVKAILQRRLQEEGIKTYLITFGGQYTSVHLQTLCEMFDLPESTVHKIVSKLIVCLLCACLISWK